MEIREYLPADSRNDYGKLKKAYSRLFKDPENVRFLSHTGIPFDDEKIDKFFQLHRSQGNRFFCSLDDDRDIIAILISKDHSYLQMELFAMVVDHRYRRMGTGKKLIKYVAEYARRENFRSLETAVFANNKPMLKLLIEIDFLPVRMLHHLRYDGSDLLLLKKYL
jgi:GNAT superfamily N-acetyltransferase